MKPSDEIELAIGLISMTGDGEVMYADGSRLVYRDGELVAIEVRDGTE